MDNRMVTTAFELPGFIVAENLGVVRGLTVRSRSVVGNFFGGLQSLFGGNITIYSELCEQARSEAFELMCLHARQRNADAIIAMHYDATELMPGLTEVLCYGTAVKLRSRAA
jgi:uncharacterized protein YbjQ (UPF0145 family)